MAINVATREIPNEVTIDFSSLDCMNKILSMYPDRKILFMDAPAALDVDGERIEAQTVKSSFQANSVCASPTLDDLTHDIREILDEFFDYIGDKVVYLYMIVINYSAEVPYAKVRASF